MANQTDIHYYVRASARAIEKELQVFSKLWNKQITNAFPDLQTMTQRFTDGFLGGKMLRGTLVCLGYELVQNEQTQAILKPAAAFEILHTSLIIHDDIIDQSPTRRGQPAMHLHQNAQYGISQAICLGDLGISQAVKLLSESDFQTDRKMRAITYFSQIISDTILGEMLDVQSSHTEKPKEEQIFTIHTMKTARYTIVGPMTVGAILGEADEMLLNNITRFGEHLGIAYQIQDDILGIFGDEKKMGKSVTSDIEENKSTLLLTYTLQQGTDKQKEMLKKYYGKKGITKEQHEIIKKIFIASGALAYSQKHMNNLVSKAKAVIPDITKNRNNQELLLQLTEALVNKSK